MVEREVPEPADDGQLIPEVGAWSKDKHHFLRRYIYAFTTAMRQKWDELHYIDLFAGAGIDRVREGGLEWGSPLLAAMTDHQFTRLHFSELEKEKVSALRKRLARFPQRRSEPQVLCGDANVCVNEIVREIPGNALSLAFVDPHRLADLRFETLQVLSRRKTDLIVFFPDYLDAVRNVGIYRGNPSSPLSQFMGTTGWEEVLEGEPRSTQADLLAEFFEDQLRTLGYSDFAEQRIGKSETERLYKLVFASRNPAGGKIWRGVSKKLADGQLKLWE